MEGSRQVSSPFAHSWLRLYEGDFPDEFLTTFQNDPALPTNCSPKGSGGDLVFIGILELRGTKLLLICRKGP